MNKPRLVSFGMTDVKTDRREYLRQWVADKRMLMTDAEREEYRKRDRERKRRARSQ